MLKGDKESRSWPPLCPCVHSVPVAQAWVTWSGSDHPAPRKCICSLAGRWPASRPFPPRLVLITALTHHCIMQPSLGFHSFTSPSSRHMLCLCLWTHCHWGLSLSPAWAGTLPVSPKESLVHEQVNKSQENENLRLCALVSPNSLRNPQTDFVTRLPGCAFQCSGRRLKVPQGDQQVS